MSKEFELAETARRSLLTHLKDISEAVGSTMGPGGRSFAYDKAGTDMSKTYSWSKDGLTVLRALDFSDEPSKEAVLSYCRQASAHTVLASGDGTSSTIVLAGAVAEAILGYSEDSSEQQYKHPQRLARQLEKDAQIVIEAIKQEAIKSEKVIKIVGNTSANGDEELTEVVMKAVSMSSAYGSILTIKSPANSERYVVSQQDGYSNCSGYNYNHTFAISADDEAASSKTMDWKEPYVVAFNGHLMNKEQWQPIYAVWKKLCETDPRRLIVVTFEVGDAVVNEILPINRMFAPQGISAFVVKPKLTVEVNAPLQVMSDICSYCGITTDKIIDGGNYKDVDESFFGTCQNVKITTTATMFLGRAKNHWVEKRIKQNEHISNAARSHLDREITIVRNAELAEGLVSVEIGGGMLPDLDEREARFDDSSKAVQSCMKYGALPGSGFSYIRAGQISDVHPLLSQALTSIFRQVSENFGENLELGKIQKGEAFCVLPNDKYIIGDAEEHGVLDACETVCSVIKNGVDLGVKIATLGGYSFRSEEK